MVPAVMLGDFNVIINPSMDRVRVDATSATDTLSPFGRMLQETAFVDLWRSKYPQAHQYSCHSNTYQSLSRIDLIIGNSLARNLTIKVEYLTRGISDHSPMLLTLRIPGMRRRDSLPWKLNPFWLTIIDMEQVAVAVTEYFSINNGSTTVNTVWDAFKAFLRGFSFTKLVHLKLKGDKWKGP